MTKPHRVPLATLEEKPSVISPPTEPTAAHLPSQPVPPEELEKYVVEALKTCYDPEIPLNIHELGLIYGIDIQPPGAVTILMTLTSPACPVAGSLPSEVQQKVKAIPGVTSVQVDLVWDPPWDPGRMSEAARLQLGIDW